jgi:hypothetical protein
MKTILQLEQLAVKPSLSPDCEALMCAFDGFTMTVRVPRYEIIIRESMEKNENHR